MSLLGKIWKIKNQDPKLSISEKILANRGLISPEEIDKFFKLSYKKGMHNPFLMKGMESAVNRIKKAIQNEERMMIFGDYDVDGISGTAILYHSLKLRGAKVSYRLPHRVEHGYGLNNDFIDEFEKLDVKLLVTVDCGISCKEQIKYAKEKNIDVIITDHHTIPEEFPDDAYAILHPNQPGCDYPFKGLTGAGVAYKLATALIKDHFDTKLREQYVHDLLDLASLGTVADLGPLVGENRIIVKYGLDALQNTRWQGLNYLKNLAGIEPTDKLDINTIGFRLGPRINAAGRIDDPYYALQLLLQDTDDEKAKTLAEHLDNLNTKRQKMVLDALEQLEERLQTREKKNQIIVAWDKDWHVGILGLLAAKCVEKYNVPAIIMQDFGDYLVGSSRGPEWFNLVEALTKHSDLLENFGGHIQAAGFTIPKSRVEQFNAKMKAYAHAIIENTDWRPTLEIDAEIKEEEIEEGLMLLL
ncbi:single-stranded-DNA-specific exonuclease RecJ, partial [Candidatus Peregrinibacteria bacterium]|nr:single-stranded-DNA-specific exonuclease RecJ [Candidatus Peregrinibacteria bacterium]